jgi:Flp pilus assembly protein TadD
VHHAEFSPDGSLVVTTDEGGSARVWDAATGAAVSPPMMHDAAVSWASFSPDSRSVVTASRDRTARIWDARSGRPRTPYITHDERVNRATFSPDGRLIATGCGGRQPGNVGQARLFDAYTGEFVSMPLTHGDAVLAVSFDPTGRTILTAASRDTAARLWLVGPDNRPVADLERLGAVLSGTQVDESGGLALRSSNNISRDHAWILSRYPRDLAARPGDLLAWHDDEAKGAEAASAWTSAVAHLDPLVNGGPTSSSYFSRRGRAHAELGHWVEAARDYRQALAAGSENRIVWYESQLLQLKVGDLAAYRAASRDLMQRFGQTLDLRQANDIAYICVLAPDATPEPEQVLALALRASQGLSDEQLLILNTVGAAQYRAGHYREAIGSLEKSIQLSVNREGMQSDWTFLAMAYHRLNNLDQARRCLTNARRLAGVDAAQRADGAKPPASSQRWQDALHNTIILSEPESLVDPPR